jgi:hypothetical protein
MQPGARPLEEPPQPAAWPPPDLPVASLQWPESAPAERRSRPAAERPAAARPRPDSAPAAAAEQSFSEPACPALQGSAPSPLQERRKQQEWQEQEPELLAGLPLQEVLPQQQGPSPAAELPAPLAARSA